MVSSAADPIRVVHLASGREWRGGQRQVYLLARALSPETEVVSSVVTGDKSLLAERCRTAGVTVHGAPWRMGIDPRVMPALLGAITPGTLIHAHDQHAHTLADAAARIRGGRVIVTRRVDFPIRHPGRWRRVDHAIALSEAVRQRLMAAGVAPERISVIPPAVDLDALATAAWPADLATRSDDHQLVVTIAALSPEKGIDLLLAAAARVAEHHPHARWLVLGEGRDRAALERQRADLGLDDLVDFAGHIAQPEGVLSHATLLVQPSRSEGFGSAVLDALGLGVPVIASDVGGLPESLADGGGVLVPANDVDALVRAVGGLLDDPARRQLLSVQGRRAAAHFAVPRLVSRTLAIYRAVYQLPS